MYAPNVVKELKHLTAEKIEAIKDALAHFEIIDNEINFFR